MAPSPERPGLQFLWSSVCISSLRDQESEPSMGGRTGPVVPDHTLGKSSVSTGAPSNILRTQGWKQGGGNIYEALAWCCAGCFY